MSEPANILNAAFQRATVNLSHSLVADSAIRDRVEFVAGNVANKAGVRLLMACLLAKIHNSSVDVRKPYTRIGGVDSFSGRKYDENYITDFINLHSLPCNSTSAFLTPAFRNRFTLMCFNCLMRSTRDESSLKICLPKSSAGCSSIETNSNNVSNLY